MCVLGRKPSHLLHLSCRCYKMVGLTVPETKDCVKAAAMGLEYKEPRPTTEFSIQREIEAEVDKMMVSTAKHAVVVVQAKEGKGC